MFEETDWRITFVGDVHIPMIIGRRCEQKFSATQHHIVMMTNFYWIAPTIMLFVLGQLVTVETAIADYGMSSTTATRIRWSSRLPKGVSSFSDAS